MKKTVKSYYAHQGSAFIMGIFSLLFAGSFALLFFFPAFSLTTNSGGTVDYMGYEMFLLGAAAVPEVRGVFPAEISFDNADVILNLMNAYEGNNFIFSTFKGFHNWVALGISAIGVLGLLLAVFVAILGLVWFIRGRTIIPKSVIIVGHWSNGLYDACVGLLYAYLFIFTEMGKEGSEGANAAMAIYPFVILGIHTVVFIVLRITHHFAYKNRVFEKKKKNENNGSKIEIQKGTESNNNRVNNNQADDTSKEAEYKPVYTKGLPPDLTMVGDNSFKDDKALTNAVIPEGISSLGSCAFMNCQNLETVTIPVTVIKIGPNCFNNTPHLTTINYMGTKEDWRTVKRGSNWLVGSGTDRINTRDGVLVVNPNQ